MPLSTPYFHNKVEHFLSCNGLRLEEVDLYIAVLDADGRILAGGGLFKDIIKCIAVAPEARSEGLATPLVSRLIAEASARGFHHVKVFTKPENQAIFESLGFKRLAAAPQAILMENGRGLDQYCSYLEAQRRPGKNGVVIMNANPFSLGHLYLLQEAVKQVDTLYVIPVMENVSSFPYPERKAMIQAAAPKGTVILEGSDYQISAATFPTYFLKDLSQAARTQMQLDLDLFSRHIAPALEVSIRFVGSEPTDALTANYNTLMKELLPMEVVEIPRFALSGNHPVTASAVRARLEAGDFAGASALCPGSTWPYLLASLAERALRMELDTPLKPGLVGPDSNGAHKDMDYSTMQRGIAALRPYWSRMVLASSAGELQSLGIEAEKAMMAATGGVNTHRGAIFCLGLALNAFGREMEVYDNEKVTRKCLIGIAQTLLANQLKNSNLHFTPGSLKDARAMAAEGYQDLFKDWLPYLRKSAVSLPEESAHASKSVLQKTLLRIMSTLDDTCVIKRVGAERAHRVKEEARETLGSKDFNKDLNDLCDRFAAEGISPGGAADMLALTIFINSITN